MNNQAISDTTPGEVLRTIRSVCSNCLKEIPTEILLEQGKVWLRKNCPEHGEEKILESSSLDFYHTLTEQKPSSKRSLKLFEEPSAEPLGPSCVALIEITNACNLECPLCFAASGPGRSFFITLAEFKARIEALIARKGALDIVMISGGEPTVHPQLGELLEYCNNHQQIGHIMLNTNGLALAKNENVRAAVLKAWDKLELYLQFDSLEAATVAEIRGDPGLVQTKLKALEWCTENKVPTTFAAALRPTVSEAELAALITLAISLSNVRGITFQPAFASGRHTPSFEPNARLTTPQVIELICKAGRNYFDKGAFVNLPCSHPNCAIVSYFFRHSGRLWSVTRDLNPGASLEGRINFNLEDLSKCGCDTTELGKYISTAELSAHNSFRIVVKPFMDRFNLNRDRTKLCCTHIVGPQGKVMSFCEYNVFRETMHWNTNQP